MEGAKPVERREMDKTGHPHGFLGSASQICSGAGFLHLSTMNTGGQIIPLWGCPVHCRIFSSTPGLHPLDASTHPLSPNDQKCPHTLPIVP